MEAYRMYKKTVETKEYKITDEKEKTLREAECEIIKYEDEYGIKPTHITITQYEYNILNRDLTDCVIASIYGAEVLVV